MFAPRSATWRCWHSKCVEPCQCDLVATIVLQRRNHASVAACGKDFVVEVNADCAVADRKDIGKASTDGAALEIVKRYFASLSAYHDKRSGCGRNAPGSMQWPIARTISSPRSVGESVGPASATAIQPTETAPIIEPINV